MDENSFSNKETKQPTRANMKILKASSNVKSYWSCEFFIKLVSKYEAPIFGSIDSEVGPKIKKEPNSLNEVLELHGVTSNLRAIQSKEEFEVRRRVEEILANEAPSIKQQTSLHKIFWYRIWLFLILQGVLKKAALSNITLHGGKIKGLDISRSYALLKIKQPIKSQFLLIFSCWAVFHQKKKLKPKLNWLSH